MTALAPDYVVVSDGRFRNEVLNVKRDGGTAFNILRPKNQLQKQAEHAGIRGHVSETELTGIPEHFWSDTLVNDSTIEEFKTEVQNTMFFFYQDDRLGGVE